MINPMTCLNEGAIISIYYQGVVREKNLKETYLSYVDDEIKDNNHINIASDKQ